MQSPMKVAAGIAAQAFCSRLRSLRLRRPAVRRRERSGHSRRRDESAAKIDVCIRELRECELVRREIEMNSRLLYDIDRIPREVE